MFKKTVWSFFYIILPFVFFMNMIPESYHLPFLTLNWYKDINKNTNAINPKRAIEYNKNFYYFNNYLFYYNQSGDVTHFLTMPPETFITPFQRGYFLHNKVGEKIFLYKNNGELLWKKDTVAVPVSQNGDVFFLVSTDLMSLSMYDKNLNAFFEDIFVGSLILDYSFSSFDSSFIFGTSKGDLKIISNDGKTIFSHSFSNSKYNYIKSVFINDKSTYFGAVHGMTPEYISLFSKDGELLWEQKTNLIRNRKVNVYIDDFHNNVIEEKPKSIIFRKFSSGEIRQELDLSKYNPKNEDISYLKASFSDQHMLFLIRFKTTSLALLLDSNYKIVWYKNLNEQYPISVELRPKSFLIQTSLYIFDYDINL